MVAAEINENIVEYSEPVWTVKSWSLRFKSPDARAEFREALDDLTVDYHRSAKQYEPDRDRAVVEYVLKFLAGRILKADQAEDADDEPDTVY